MQRCCLYLKNLSKNSPKAIYFFLIFDQDNTNLCLGRVLSSYTWKVDIEYYLR